MRSGGSDLSLSLIVVALVGALGCSASDRDQKSNEPTRWTADGFEVAESERPLRGHREMDGARLWVRAQKPAPEDTVVWQRPARLRAVEGSLFVLDEVARQLVLVGPDGGILDRIGRAGEGPGEMREPSELVRLPNRILVLDRGRGRLLVFGHGGRLQGEIPLRSVPMRIFPVGARSLGLQGLAGRSRSYRLLRLERLGTRTRSTHTDTTALVEMMATSRDHLVPRDAGRCIRWSGWSTHVARMSCYVPVVDLFLPTGEPDRRIRLDQEPVPTAGSVLDSLRKEVKKRVSSVGLADDVRDEVIERTVNRYRYHRRFRGIRYEPASRLLFLWEQGPSWTDDQDGSAALHVVRLDGTYLARLAFSSRWKDFDVGRRRLYAVTVVPESGLRSVVAWRLPENVTRQDPAGREVVGDDGA